MIDLSVILTLLVIFGIWLTAPILIISYLLKICGFTKIGDMLLDVTEKIIIFVVIVSVLAIAYAITSNLLHHALYIDITSVSVLEELLKIKIKN